MNFNRHILQVFVGALSPQYEALSIEVSKQTTCVEIIACIVERLGFSDPHNYQLAEVVGNIHGEECKERRLGPNETPYGLQVLWPTQNAGSQEECEYRFCLREKSFSDSLWAEPSQLDSQLIKDYFYKFLYQPKDKEYPDLCQLTNLNEQTLLENLKARFSRGHIYTYVGSILISVNPFKYYPIYNPKYVKLYQNHRLGDLPPHIFAIADAAYHCMLKQKRNQCIVISGESGSGKTEATLFLLHHLTMLSQKGSHGSGVEQTILSSGPVLEAFGNAKTAHNNNSSRFGKFIQVTYKENGFVQGACVQKYLLEKSRICSQAHNERSYHVFYYLLAGASNQERQALHLLKPSDYRYLNQSQCYTIDGCDEQYEFVRLKQSMDMVGFTPDKQQRLFAILSAVLLLGNIDFSPKKSTYHHDESVVVRNWEVACTIASLLGVSEDTLVSALTSKKAKVQGETLVINYRMNEALATRSALAKCLYGALFDWIVLQINYSLISLKESGLETSGNSIGVLDIFGFEDFGRKNRFEQFCINYANEHLQHYFNQHVFEYEQEEYYRENIGWKNIDFQDNVQCLALIEGRPNGLLCILNDQCNFPGATNETFLEKTNSVQKNNKYYEIPQKKELAFIIRHYAGKVKYQAEDMREKNLDLMRPELTSVLKNSCFSIVRELAGADPVAVFRWAILRSFFRAVSALKSGTSKYKRKVSDELRNYPRQKVSVDHSRILAAIENTQNRLRKTRHNRSRYRTHGSRNQKNLKTVKALAQKTQTLTFQGRVTVSRKIPLTVTGQFQLSLQALMEALNQSNPYFIRCIKSNANKEANMFDDELVQRQLRYTGMLETVRIRQAGFNVRMTYEEFIHHYRILLPRGLVSSQADVKVFLKLAQLNGSEYQTGKSKIFMRESQKQKLDTLLHQTILSRIITIQRWYRSRHDRRKFLALRNAVIRIQAQIRCWLAQQLLTHMRMEHAAATCIQRVWRGYRIRTWYQSYKHTIIRLQARARGKLARTYYKRLVNDYMEGKEKTSNLETKESAFNTSRAVSEPKDMALTDLEIVRESEQYLISKQESMGNRIQPKIFDDVDYRSQSDISRSDQECLPPPRRKTGLHRLSPLQRLSSEPFGIADESHGRPMRRYSEASVVPKPLPRQGNARNSYEGSTGSLLKDDANGKPFKNRSFRHRHYQKTPPTHTVVVSEAPQYDGQCKNGDEKNADETATTTEKFPKIKRHFRTFIAGSISESDDNSCGSSGAHTPTSVGDSGFAFNTPPIVSTKNAHSFDDTSAIERRESTKSKDALLFVSKSSQSKSLDYSVGKKGVLDCGDSSNDHIRKFLATTHHNLKQSQFRKGEICSSCDRPFTKFFINQGYKCTSCKRLFHSSCVERSGLVSCTNVKESLTVPKRPERDESHWSLTRTSQFIDKSDDVIKDAYMLRALEEFITKKAYSLEENTSDLLGQTMAPVDSDDSKKKGKPHVDQLFCLSLRRYKTFLVSTYSVALQKDSPDIALKYKDLIKSFEKVMTTVCQDSNADSTFPVTMGVNAFRGFLDEFVRSQEKSEEKVVSKKRKRHRKKKKKTELIAYGEHRFNNIMINIPMLCEICNALLWLSMKAYSCQKCKLTCHQRCHKKADQTCSAQHPTKAVVVSMQNSKNSMKAITPKITKIGKVFNLPLESLVGPGEKVPKIAERLFLAIEIDGIYTEGLYRKTGALAKAQELKSVLDADPDSVDLANYPVHVLATTLKSFLRELPEPLLTFDAYDPLLHASFLEEDEDKFMATLNVVQNLPKQNYDLLERLVFHLARVAQYECFNRMSCNSLAIVFTPCILKSPRDVPVQESLNDISKQTLVIEILIDRQLKKVHDVLRDIDNVDTASSTADAKLASLKTCKAKLTTRSEREPSSVPSGKFDPRDALAMYNLEEHIQTLQKTRNILTLGLPDLVRGSSEEDLLSTDMSRTGSYEDVSTSTSTLGTPTGSSIRSSNASTFYVTDDYSSLDARLDRRKQLIREKEKKECDDDDTVMV